MPDTKPAYYKVKDHSERFDTFEQAEEFAAQHGFEFEVAEDVIIAYNAYHYKVPFDIDQAVQAPFYPPGGKKP